MNAKQALEKLGDGDKVKTNDDGDDIFYQMFQPDVIARMVTKSYCSAETIAYFTPEQFLSDHRDIVMVESNI